MRLTELETLVAKLRTDAGPTADPEVDFYEEFRGDLAKALAAKPWAYLSFWVSPVDVAEPAYRMRTPQGAYSIPLQVK